MAFTLDELTAIKEAYVSGAVEVEYADKKVKYRSLADMRTIIKEMEAELGIKKPIRRTIGVIYR